MDPNACHVFSSDVSARHRLARPGAANRAITQRGPGAINASPSGLRERRLGAPGRRGRRVGLQYTPMMEQRISLITLGVGDLQRARAFYERLGWHGQEIEEDAHTQPLRGQVGGWLVPEFDAEFLRFRSGLTRSTPVRCPMQLWPSPLAWHAPGHRAIDSPWLPPPRSGRADH